MPLLAFHFQIVMAWNGMVWYHDNHFDGKVLSCLESICELANISIKLAFFSLRFFYLHVVVVVVFVFLDLSRGIAVNVRDAF